jgi:hypothetical protein
MSQLPPAPAKLQPLTNSQTRCRRLGRRYVDILGFTNDQLVERQAWCQEQASRLALVVRDMPRKDIERLLVTDWDLCVAEAAWVVDALR